MAGSSKKKCKNGKVSDNQLKMDSQSQGIEQPNTPPTGLNSMQFNNGVNMMTSNLIGQSNDILYHNPVHQGAQMIPPPPILPLQMPMNPGHVQPQSHTQSQNPSLHTNRMFKASSSPSAEQNQCSTLQITNVLQSLDQRLSKIESQLNQQSQQMGHQNNRIQNIERHVEQITVLQQTVTQIQMKVYSIDTDMTNIKTKHRDYEKSIQTYSNMCDDVLKSQVATNERLNSLDDKINFILNTELENMKVEHNDLKEEFLDSKSRQMCENLIFTGIPEVSLNPGEIENCEETLREFLACEMDIRDNIQFDRVHRLGRYKRQHSFPRSIIAKFHNYKTKEMVKQKAPSTLRNKNFGVREQYPDEYERRRKVLYPKMKSAKQNPENKVKMVKDTLYINNNKYKCGTDDTPVLIQTQNPENVRSKNQYASDRRATRQNESRSYQPRQPARSQGQGAYRKSSAYDTERFRSGYSTTARNSFTPSAYSCDDTFETANMFTSLRGHEPVNPMGG